MTEPQSIGTQLSKIYDELSFAIRCMEIATQIEQTTVPLYRLNSYKGFLRPTYLALQSTALAGLAKVLDRHRDSLSLFKLMDRIQGNPDGFNVSPGSLDIDSLRRKLEPHQEIIDQIKEIRDQFLSHLDPNSDMETDNGQVHLAAPISWTVLEQC